MPSCDICYTEVKTNERYCPFCLRIVETLINDVEELTREQKIRIKSWLLSTLNDNSQWKNVGEKYY